MDFLFSANDNISEIITDYILLRKKKIGTQYTYSFRHYCAILSNLLQKIPDTEKDFHSAPVPVL